MKDIEDILAIYRAEISTHPDFVLEILVHHYGIECEVSRQAYINALVEHFRKQLEAKQ